MFTSSYAAADKAAALIGFPPYLPLNIQGSFCSTFDQSRPGVSIFFVSIAAQMYTSTLLQFDYHIDSTMLHTFNPLTPTGSKSKPFIENML